MSDPKTCLTCHWWFRFQPTDKVGVCVFHNGVRKSPVEKVAFGGTLKTVPGFGCNCWEENRRVEVPE